MSNEEVQSKKYEFLTKGYGTMIYSYQGDDGCYVLKAARNKIVQGKKNKPCTVQSSQFSELLDREYRIGSQFSHPNIVQYFCLREQYIINNQNFYTLQMEHLYGDAHKNYIENGQGGGGVAQLKEQFRLLAQALSHIHEKQIAHNDIKPENIFYTKDGLPKLGDLGCARVQNKDLIVQQSEQIRQEWISRDLLFAGPEIFNFIETKDECFFDEISSDIFALGQTFFRMAYGSLPRKLKRPSENCDIYRHIQIQDLQGFQQSVSKTDTLFLDLVMRMMNPSIESRLTIQQVLQHPFFC